MLTIINLLANLFPLSPFLSLSLIAFNSSTNSLSVISRSISLSYDSNQSTTNSTNQFKRQMLQQQRKIKQLYLREHILEKGYDAEQFISYLNTTLKIDSDLNVVSIDEIKDVVKTFKEEKQNTIVEKIGDLEQSKIYEKKDLKKSAIVYKQFEPPLIEQQFESTFKCMKILPKQPAQIMAKMRCEVTNPQRKYSGGVFGIGGTSFLQFVVTTSGVNWNVGRRYSDFVWFRNALKKFYPSLIIPPIPNKKASKRATRQIEKRMRILTYFLNDLVKIPEIANSRHFEGFLSIKDPSKFQKFKSEVDNKVTFESISSLQTQSGMVSVSLTNKNINYYRQLKNFVDKSEVLYKEVTRASKRFQAQRIDQVNQLYDLGNKFADLYDVGKTFHAATKNENIHNLNEIYIKLNNMMIQWGNNIKNEVDLLEVNFNTFFKYARQSYMGFHEFFEKVDEVEKNFLMMKKELDSKKEKIFVLHDPTKWQISKKDVAFVPKSSVHNRQEAFKIMLPKQSVEVETQKTNYSFYLSRLCENSNVYFEKQMVKFNENFNEVAIKSKVLNQQLGESWNEMCYIFSEGGKAAKKVMQMERLKQLNELSQSQIVDG